MYCTACGAKNEDGVKFCTKCGANMGGSAQQSNQVAPTDMGRVRRLFHGRIARLHYFYGLLFCLALSLVPLFVFVTLWGIVNLISNASGSTGPVYEIFNLLIPVLIALSLVLPLFLGHIFLAIRRCHDFGSSGWLTLCSLIPYIGLIFVLVFLFRKGEEGSNQYGHAPRSDKKFLADFFNY